MYAGLNDRDAVALLRYHAERIAKRCNYALEMGFDADVLSRLYSAEEEIGALIAIADHVRQRMEQG